jgi:hypothetical protein
VVGNKQGVIPEPRMKLRPDATQVLRVQLILTANSTAYLFAKKRLLFFREQPQNGFRQLSLAGRSQPSCQW